MGFMVAMRYQMELPMKLAADSVIRFANVSMKRGKPNCTPTATTRFSFDSRLYMIENVKTFGALK